MNHGSYLDRAHKRMEAMDDPFIMAIYRKAFGGQVCPHCGRAAEDINRQVSPSHPEDSAQAINPALRAAG